MAKPAIQSMGVWGGTLGFLSSVSSLAFAAHHAFEPIAMALQDVLCIVGVVGGLLAVYGRWRAGGVRLPVVGAATPPLGTD